MVILYGKFDILLICLFGNKIKLWIAFQAPPRADVIRSLKNGIVLNMLGMGAAVLGMQATVGALVAKALTTSAVPYYQATSPGQSPVLALDVFLVQVFDLHISFLPLNHFLSKFSVENKHHGSLSFFCIQHSGAGFQVLNSFLLGSNTFVHLQFF